MPFSIVVAMATNNIIGKNNKLPWSISEGLEYFYKVIKGKPIVMGRKTYESIGGAIKNSPNIVLSHDRSLQLPGCVMVHSVAEVLALYKHYTDEVMVIGGAEIYRQFLPYVNKMYLTLIHSDVEGDTYFPKWENNGWKVTWQRDSSSNLYAYSFIVSTLIT